MDGFRATLWRIKGSYQCLAITEPQQTVEKQGPRQLIGTDYLPQDKRSLLGAVPESCRSCDPLQVLGSSSSEV